MSSIYCVFQRAFWKSETLTHLSFNLYTHPYWNSCRATLSSHGGQIKDRCEAAADDRLAKCCLIFLNSEKALLELCIGYSNILTV